MLPAGTTTTPRPPPPAKARKSSSLNFASFAPPPPYAPSAPRHEETILDSPISVTTQLMQSRSRHASIVGMGLPGTPGLEDWMNEKSREELSGLLLKADGIIKSRETELSLTSALCKSLYSDNFTLKTKHEALLARLPTTPTPVVSQPSSPRFLEPPSLHSFSGVAFPTTPDDSGSSSQPSSSSALLRGIRRTRRISVTPAELASLSDQNAELLEKLEQLESESFKADQAGKRKLRKLEQEIQVLRDELERTQARGAELEEQARVAAAHVAVVERRKERDTRIQARKEREAEGSEGSGDVMDFAPPSEFASRSSTVKRSPSGGSSLSMGTTAVEPTDLPLVQPYHPGNYDDAQSDGQELYLPEHLHGSIQSSTVPADVVIISQLLAKIRELEETNTQINEEQKLTEERMRAARWDAESIRRVYDCLDDGDVDLEIQEEDEDSSMDFGSLPLASNGTIRFSSLRRSIVGDMNKSMSSESDVFAGGITQHMQSTVRDGAARQTSGSKIRKPIVGLFDSDADTSASSSGWGEYPSALKVSPAFRSGTVDSISAWSASATDGLASPSQTISSMQLPMDRVRTLGSELGSEFGDDWAERGINHHLRASSLYDLAGLSASSPVSPTESHTPLPPIIFPAAEEHSTEEWDGSDPTTPPRGPQFTLQPPTPTPDKLRSPTATRQYRLSQTVRSRTNRWVEGRIVSTPSSPPAQRQTHEPSPLRNDSSESQVLRKRSSATLGRRAGRSALASAGASALIASTGLLGETFDSAVGQIRRVASRGSFGFVLPPAPPHEEERPETPQAAEEGAQMARGVNASKDECEAADEHEEADRSLSLRHGASVADPLNMQHAGVVGFILEVWLWLQFIIVIALFLWTMAKRGPKVVLEAERRNAQRVPPRS